MVVAACVCCAVHQDKAGGVAPTKKGISLSQAEWSALQGAMQATNQALADNDEAFAAELPNSIRVTTSVFGYGMPPSCTCLSLLTTNTTLALCVLNAEPEAELQVVACLLFEARPTTTCISG